MPVLWDHAKMEETVRLTAVAATSVNVLWELEAKTVPKVSIIVLEIHLTMQPFFNLHVVWYNECRWSCDWLYVQEIGTISTKRDKSVETLPYRNIHFPPPPPPPCYPTPSPQVRIFFFDPQILSSTTNNIDSGGGGLTAFKQSCLINEIVHKSARFIEVCQLLFVTDCSLKAKEILDTLTNTLF